ncbi:hypothetical protein [Ktedonospora formicarum]|uniref:Lipoprotein n=1 Tax=Ktedonospora formicarum TaxID=2778364 RepID=A0A8J3MQM4_9CHLR|nr:hypothetical protein [Ktedonospora formicarum]GHO42926.1 hypothetical protein KSX_10890 [Ktedonospora formicarum]
MRRLFSLKLFLLSLGLLLLLAACGSRNGTVPSGTPDTGNGTPAILPSPTIRVQDAPTGSKVGYYTFIRQRQLWVALNSESATQLTHFDFAQTPEVFWQPPSWSENHKYLAFLFNALPVGVGGGGCPGPDYTTTSSLYVLDTSTQQLTALTLPQVTTDAKAEGKPYSDSWQYAVWEDANHLLAWYNGVTGKTSTDAGLYRYDVQAHSLSKVFSGDVLGAKNPANAQQGQPMLLSMRYAQGQFYYQVAEQPGQQNSSLSIYRIDVNNASAGRQQVIRLGSEAWCTTGKSGSIVRPGWDISPDGTMLVVQTIENGTPGSEVGAIKVIQHDGSVSQTLFTQAPAAFLAHDVVLRWSPHDKMIAATELHRVSGQGPYVTSLDQVEQMQVYTPFVAGPISWRGDGEAFALQSSEAAEGVAPSDVYLFYPGEKSARLLEKDARLFSWG